MAACCCQPHTQQRFPAAVRRCAFVYVAHTQAVLAMGSRYLSLHAQQHQARPTPLPCSPHGCIRILALRYAALCCATLHCACAVMRYAAQRCVMLHYAALCRIMLCCAGTSRSAHATTGCGACYAASQLARASPHTPPWQSRHAQHQQQHKHSTSSGTCHCSSSAARRDVTTITAAAAAAAAAGA